MATYAVIGLGQLGVAVATRLAEQGGDVIAIDSEESRIDAIKDRVTRAFCMDATDERAVRAAGIAECSTVVLALGEGQLEQAVLTTTVLRELGCGRIISRASSEIQARVLERVGVSEVVFPERQVGHQLALQIMTPSVQELIPLSADACMADVAVDTHFAGKTLGELQLRKKYGVNVVAVRRRREEVRDDGSVDVSLHVDNFVGPDTTVAAGDTMVVVGTNDAVRALAAGS